MREILITALCLLFALTYAVWANHDASGLAVPAHAAVWTDQSVPASPASLDCTHLGGQSAPCRE